MDKSTAYALIVVNTLCISLAGMSLVDEEVWIGAFLVLIALITNLFLAHEINER